ncbi:MAG: hypothetical protein HZB55_07670 [Deltaproteobacteria bacterium]|nr:hypothetical protein [Deltaproteobacteria bacterium]
MHFAASTRATCHASLLTAGSEVIAARTHQMGDRAAWRIFGLVYAHTHPASADTTTPKNRAGLPLPTELTGERVVEGLIGTEEQVAREGRMKKICQSCQSRQWTEGHYEKFAESIETSSAMTLAATKVILGAWE